MKVKLKILTPVHIGSGKEISPIEYLFHNNKFIRIDMDSLFNDSEFTPLQEKFINSAKSQRYIGNLLPRDLLLKHQLYSMDISPSARGVNPIAVREFIKSAGRVYIPGSSLKGAILSAVIYKISKKKKIRTHQELREIMNLVIKEISFSPQQNRFSRWLDITDSNFKSPQEALELSLIRVKGTRERGQLPIIYETLKQGIKFQIEIRTSVDRIYKFGKLSETEILEITNEFYAKVYEKEAKSKHKQSLPQRSNNGFLLRLGQGSTCLSTSFLLLAEALGIKDYKVFRGRRLPPIEPGQEPSTRKLLEEKIPLGWVELFNSLE